MLAWAVMWRRCIRLGAVGVRAMAGSRGVWEFMGPECADDCIAAAAVEGRQVGTLALEERWSRMRLLLSLSESDPISRCKRSEGL
jgi:hypothetical protein